MTIFISPLIKGYDLFAIIEGYVFMYFLCDFSNEKRRTKMTILSLLS